MPVAAKITITVRPMTLCVIDAACGDEDRIEVRPSATGSTPSRPRENMYRATVLWNETAAATMLVTRSEERRVGKGSRSRGWRQPYRRTEHDEGDGRMD